MCTHTVIYRVVCSIYACNVLGGDGRVWRYGYDALFKGLRSGLPVSDCSKAIRNFFLNRSVLNVIYFHRCFIQFNKSRNMNSKHLESVQYGKMNISDLWAEEGGRVSYFRISYTRLISSYVIIMIAQTGIRLFGLLFHVTVSRHQGVKYSFVYTRLHFFFFFYLKKRTLKLLLNTFE